MADDVVNVSTTAEKMAAVRPLSNRRPGFIEAGDQKKKTAGYSGRVGKRKGRPGFSILSKLRIKVQR